MAIDTRDRILQEQAPLLAMPRYGALDEIQHGRHRFIGAQDGIYLEVCRPWLHAALKIADAEIALPYGALESFVAYSFQEGDLNELIALFTVDGRAALPNEFAAWGVWNFAEKRLEYRPLISVEASPGRITFHRPRLADNESLAVDLHSHGQGQAFFSPQDDEDDHGEVKLSVVAGTLDATPTYRARLCCLGIFYEGVEVDDATCRGCGCTDTSPCEGGCTWVEPDLCSRCAETMR